MRREVMKPYLSIVIPHYNNPEALEKLLVSLSQSKKPPEFEVIVVDDGSREKFQLPTSKFQIQNQKKSIKTAQNLKGYKKYSINTIPLTTIYLTKNVGPAVARNRGVARARGQFVVFMDCDVQVFPDTLHEIARVFQTDPDVVALTGVWVKEQESGDFFPNFKALRDWSYWINERDKSGYYYLFSTRIAAIKKAVFERLGGFDETYPAPLVEDIELTYRIARRYAIIFAPQVRVRHEFEPFWPVARKYFLRAYYWTKLYSSRKKFDPVATTFTEAVTAVSAVGFVGLVFVGSVLFTVLREYLSCYRVPLIATPVCIVPLYRQLLIGTLVVHLFLVRKFLVFVYREKGLVFAIQSFCMGLILYCFIFAGALWAKMPGLSVPSKRSAVRK